MRRKELGDAHAHPRPAQLAAASSPGRRASAIRRMRHVARADRPSTFLPLTMPGDINAIRGPISDHHQLQYHLSC